MARGLRSVQPGPAKPRAQAHVPCTHTPWPAQSDGEHGVCSAQSSPLQPAAQRQRPRTHTPWLEQSDGQMRTPSSRPMGEIAPRVMRRRCADVAVRAREALPPGGDASGVLQLTPRNPGAHMHVPPEQMPCDEQPDGHGAETEQSAPDHPGMHTHASPRHTPRPPQSCTQRVGAKSIRSEQSPPGPP